MAKPRNYDELSTPQKREVNESERLGEHPPPMKPPSKKLQEVAKQLTDPTKSD